MQTSEKLIKLAHKRGTPETKQILEQSFPKLFQSFENGDWIKSTATEILLRITNYDNDTCYGFRHGIWQEESGGWVFRTHPQYWRKATEEEVIEAFKKEFEKRGFKEGVKFKDPEFGTVREFKALDFCGFFNKYINQGRKQIIFSNGMRIYNDGFFAEIVEEPKTIEQRLEVLEKFMRKVETNG